MLRVVSCAIGVLMSELTLSERGCACKITSTACPGRDNKCACVCEREKISFCGWMPQHVRVWCQDYLQAESGSIRERGC